MQPARTSRGLSTHPQPRQKLGFQRFSRPFPIPPQQGPQPPCLGCGLCKQALVPTGSVLAVWGLAPESNPERRGGRPQNSLPLPHPGPLIQAGLWAQAPSVFQGTSLSKKDLPRQQSKPAGGWEGREEEKVPGSKRPPLRAGREGWDRIKQAELCPELCPLAALRGQCPKNWIIAAALRGMQDRF